MWILDLSRTVKINEARFQSVNLAIPRTLLAPLVSDPDGLHNLTLDHGSPLGALLSRYLVDLADQAARMSAAEAVRAVQATVQLISGCAGPSLDARDEARDGITAATMAAIRTYIDFQLADPSLDSDSICQHFGLSRATLYRLFQPLGDVSAHIRRRRLARSFHDIVTPGPSRVSDIAFRWGFANAATFSRAFRDVFGVSPAEARATGYEKYAQDGTGAMAGSADQSELSQWIRSLMRY